MSLSVYEKVYQSWLVDSYADETPRNGTVYHYTDANGLLGILRTGEIFATDYRFLNDRSELSHGVEASTDLCRRLTNRTSDRTLARFAIDVIRYLHVPSDIRSFVTSFSEKPDDLSQWRGYASDGEGFTIGLDADWLIRKSNTVETFGFAKVSYSKSDFEANVSKAIGRFRKYIQDGTSDEDLDEAAAWCDAAIETLCAFFKHSSFQSEREWRIIEHTTDETGSPQINVRSRGNSLVPYISVNLKDDDGRIPLRSVGIGPSFANPATSQVVRDLCNSLNYQPEIYSAKTPYQRL